MHTDVTRIDGLPDLAWTSTPGIASFDADAGALTLTSEARVDWFDSPLEERRERGATALVFDAPQRFTLSARVAVVGERSTFDAGALALWIDDEHWAKLCFEQSPQGQAMVVSVVTNTWSDDVNSTPVTADHVWMRISRLGEAWAFHSSTDGVTWDFVRVFRLHSDAPARIGFLSQAPAGPPCTARFDEIALGAEPPTDLRDGS
ncbi:DUF1349 domain-containing protein [Plantibacter sp. ME-Dv--P-122b]|uniref:DUF1349 domain-containing protein n=1 Tax=Plantibacter sp. ME-Dv--P-122b TaxID=3040300 RepID=UPI0025518BA4|nr:DUF1349 domain-containing protein [Plantibacter sp. ME-Dv--P-122b]